MKHAYYCQVCDRIFVWVLHPNMLAPRHHHTLIHIGEYPREQSDFQIRAAVQADIDTFGVHRLQSESTRKESVYAIVL